MHRRAARPEFTSRQREVIEMVERGLRTRDIAQALRISDRAVTAHLTRLMAAFGVSNRTALIAAFLSALHGTARTSISGRSRRREDASRLTAEDPEMKRYMDAPFLVAVTRGADHTFTFVNRMWERVMKLRRRDVLGRPVREVFPDRSPLTYASRQRAYREARPITGNEWHYRWRGADGVIHEADFDYIFQPLRDPDGAVEGLLLIATERTSLARPRGR